MRKNLIIISSLAAIIFYVSCKDPFVPKLTTQNTNGLVVEGFIDGGDSTLIDISGVRSLKGQDTAAKIFVDGADVRVEDDQNNTYPLKGMGNGHYAALWSLSPENHYRIHITTADDKDYISDFVVMKVSQPIDSINYHLTKDGAQFYVNTHDNSRQTTFYRWDFSETWEYHSTFVSQFYYDPSQVKIFPRTEQVEVCWQINRNNQILVNSTANLQKDEVSQFPINLIPYGDVRLGVLYSIQVKQFAMDTLGFNFFDLLKKNSEQMGTLFDPQPNNIRGNIHNIKDPSEIVIGYVGAGVTSSKRTFFQIPWSYQQNCPEVKVVPNNKDSLVHYFGQGGYIPLLPETGGGKDTTAWDAGFNLCTDCTLRGGTNVKPSYWP